MATAIGGTNGISLQDGNVKRFFALRVVPAHGDNLIEQVCYDENGVELGTMSRAKMTNNGLVAMDLPGVSAEFFVRDPDSGHIIDG